MRRCAVLSALAVVWIIGLSLLVPSTALATDVSGTLTTSTTWTLTGSPYTVLGSVTVAPGATLTIEPGVEVRFTAGTSLVIQGTLIANGTSGQHIVFTSAKTTPNRGDWGRVSFEAGSSASQMTYCDISYGGAGLLVTQMVNIASPLVSLNSCTLSNSATVGLSIQSASPSIQNCAFQDNLTYGVEIISTSTAQAKPTLSGNAFRRNALGAARMHPNSAPVLSANTAESNAVNGILVRTGSVDISATWYSNDLPYVLEAGTTVSSAATLVLQPGLVVKAKPSASLTVNGTLSALGTDAAPIYFTSLKDDAHGGDTDNNGSPPAPAPGDWARLRFTAGSANSHLTHINLLYGGVGPQTNEIIAIETSSFQMEICEVGWSGNNGLTVKQVSPQISQSSFHDNAKAGIEIQSSSAVVARPAVTNCDFQGNGKAIYLQTNAAPTLSDNTASGNALNAVVIQSGFMSISFAWPNGGLPYLLDGSVTLSAGYTLTVPAGATVKFMPGASLTINGTLVAGDLSGSPAAFTSLRDDEYGGDTNNNGATSSPAPGDWGRIYLTASSAASRLHNCVIRYGGTGTNISELLRVETSSAEIRSCTIARSATRGVYIHRVSPQLRNLTVASNAQVGVELFSGQGLFARPEIRDSVFMSNTQAIRMNASCAPVLSGNTAYGNALNGVVMPQSNVEAAQTWAGGGLPYVAEGTITVNTNVALTLQPGTVMKFAAGTSLAVNGTLVASATSVSTIVFTSLKDDSFGGDTNNNGSATLPAPGDWGHLSFASSSTGNMLSNIQILYGGSGYLVEDSLYIGTSALTMGESLVASGSKIGIQIKGASPALQKNAIRDNGTDGVRVENSSATLLWNEISGHSAAGARGIYLAANATPRLESNTFSGNTYAVYQDVSARPVLRGNLAQSNTYDGIGVCGTLAGTHAWVDDLPYYVTCDVSVALGGTLAIHPGAIVRFRENTSLRVNGTLHAIGAWFVSASAAPKPGDWGAIRFDTNSSGQITDCSIQHGGKSGEGMIVISRASPTIWGNTIRWSASRGLHVSGSTAAPQIIGNTFYHHVQGDGIALYVGLSAQPTVQNNTFADNIYGIFVSGAAPVVRHNRFRGNSQYAVYNATSLTCLDAMYNWWNSTGGPNDISSAPDSCGLLGNANPWGERVSDNVDYRNPLTVPPTRRPLLYAPWAGFTNQARPTVKGMTETEALIRLFDGMTEVISVTADATGLFTLTLPSDLTVGGHALAAVAESGGIRSGPSSPIYLNYQPAAHLEPAGLLATQTMQGTLYAQRPRTLRGAAGPLDSPAGGTLWLATGVTTTLSATPPVTQPDSMRLLYGQEVVSLTQGADGYYTGFFTPGDDTSLTLQALKDGAVAEQMFLTIRSDMEGRVTYFASGQGIAGATVTAHWWNVDADTWDDWPAHVFDSQSNPQITGPAGGYVFFPPPGRYRIHAAAPPNYGAYYSQPVEVLEEPLHLSIVLRGGYSRYLPVVMRTHTR